MKVCFVLIYFGIELSLVFNVCEFCLSGCSIVGSLKYVLSFRNMRNVGKVSVSILLLSVKFKC